MIYEVNIYFLYQICAFLVQYSNSISQSPPLPFLYSLFRQKKQNPP